ncbi:MAG: zinc-ribbon domain-containing protein [Oscillospiraceae bacterium]|nr:zinc-ribbon domain-containing protein [Oscillospiraceae bacterium]
MIYCINCGQQLQNEVQFCPSCGTSVSATSTPHNIQPSYQQHTQATAPSSDADKNKGMAIIAYLLFFIPLITGDHKKSAFVKYHTNQGIILFIFSAGLGVAISIVMAILTSLLFNVFAWGLLAILGTILNLLWFVPMIFLILGIVNASSGKEKPLPLIGNKITILK